MFYLRTYDYDSENDNWELKDELILRPDHHIIAYADGLFIRDCQIIRIYLISYAIYFLGIKKKYEFCQDNEVLDSLLIDFSGVPGYTYYVREYKPQFEYMLGKVKVKMEQEKIRQALEGL